MEPRVCLATPILDKSHPAYNDSLNKILLSGAIAEYSKIVGDIVHISRNTLVQSAIERKHTHVWLVDADQFGFNAEMLRGLLAHDVDVVSALSFMRQEPYEPLIYNFDEGGWPRTVVDYPRKSFFEVGAVGLGCCLIKTGVFEKIKWPWFQPGVTVDKRWVGENIMFCNALRNAGIKVYVDTNYCLSQVIEFPMDEDIWDLLQQQKAEQAARIKSEWDRILAD